MRALRRSIPVRIILVPLLTATFLWSCTKWSRIDGPSPEQDFQSHSPSRVRVTLAVNQQIVLAQPWVANDTLFGRASSYLGTSPYFKERSGDEALLGIPMAEVRAMEVSRTDPVKTALFIAGVGATIALVAGAIAAAESEPEPPAPSDGTTVSCPLVYSWDGSDWRLDSGTFGGAFLRPLARTDVDLLEHAAPKDGRLRLRLANELAETDHVDALSLLMVEHAPGVTVAPTSDGRFHAFRDLVPPASARDYRGRDALARIRVADGWSWESSLSQRDTADAADLRDGLELVFPRPAGERKARLLVDAHNTPWSAHLVGELLRLHGRETDAWYDSLNSDAARARSLGRKLASEAFLRVVVAGDEGWRDQGLVWEAGPEVIKRHAMELDLSDVSGDSVRVRLESVPSFWLIDRVAIEYGDEPEVRSRTLDLDRVADGTVRDAQDLLAAKDSRHLTLETGDSYELEFLVPPAADDVDRSFILKTTGWYRIHAPSVGDPQREILARIDSEPGAIARLSVARANEVLRLMASEAGR